jgi:hypothetical protein
MVAAMNNGRLFPRVRGATSPQDYIERWAKRYWNSRDNPPSRRVGQAPGTKADPLVAVILDTVLPLRNNAEIKTLLVNGHVLFKAVENQMGGLLQEFLAEPLKVRGWVCCWGETVRSVDFCRLEGPPHLLQVKNRSNTENSSSAAIREGTDILYWFRFNARTGKTNWRKLADKLSIEAREEEFEGFVVDCLKDNKKLVYLEDSFASLVTKMCTP